MTKKTKKQIFIDSLLTEKVVSHNRTEYWCDKRLIKRIEVEHDLTSTELFVPNKKNPNLSDVYSCSVGYHITAYGIRIRKANDLTPYVRYHKTLVRDKDAIYSIDGLLTEHPKHIALIEKLLKGVDFGNV